MPLVFWLVEIVVLDVVVRCRVFLGLGLCYEW